MSGVDCWRSVLRRPGFWTGAAGWLTLTLVILLVSTSTRVLLREGVVPTVPIAPAPQMVETPRLSGPR